MRAPPSLIPALGPDREASLFSPSAESLGAASAGVLVSAASGGLGGIENAT